MKFYKLTALAKYKVLFFVFSLFFLNRIYAQFSAITCNVRYDNPNDYLHAWSVRKQALCEFLRSQNPDILGLQEVLLYQLIDLDSGLNLAGSQANRYAWIGVGREDGKDAGEFCPIFFNQSKYQLIAWETRWLSTTPDIPSRGWDAALPRIATVGKFQDKKTKREFVVINTHFDHIGKVSRLNSAKYLIDVSDTLINEGIPVILMGDFNSDPKSDPIRWIHASRKFKSVTQNLIQDPRGTFNGFKNQPGPEIDFIFYSANFDLKSARVDYTHRGKDLFLSDHFPVVAVFHDMLPTMNLSISYPGTWMVQKVRLQAEFPISDKKSLGFNLTRLNVLWQTLAVGAEYRYYSAVAKSSKNGFYGNAGFGLGKAESFNSGTFAAFSAGWVQQRFYGKDKKLFLEFQVGGRAGAMLRGDLESGGGFGGLLYIAGPLSVLDFRVNMGYRF